MKLPNWMRKLNRKTHYSKTIALIEKHREITKTTEIVIDEMIASLDGETGWIDCSCLPKAEKTCKTKDDNNHVRTFSRAA